MPLELPQYMQNNTYPARLDRLFVQYAFRQQERVFEGGVVSQRAAGANTSVDISALSCVVKGDDINRQGFYLTQSTEAIFTAGFENFTMPVKPGSNSRWDIVGVRIRDAQALGSGVNNDAILDVVQGTASGSPAVPATPNSFLVLARVLRTAAETTILNAAITGPTGTQGPDVAPRGYWPFGSGDLPPVGTGVVGDIYVEW